jgi:hypothetical protein
MAELPPGSEPLTGSTTTADAPNKLRSNRPVQPRKAVGMPGFKRSERRISTTRIAVDTEKSRKNRNAPRRTRTFDPLIKSQLLYQLS